MLVLFLLSGCAVEMESADYEGGRLDFPKAETSVAQAPHVVRYMPWEVWPLGSDLQGAALRSPLLRQGDSALRSGQRAQALDSYYHAQNGPLSPSENEALVMRIASTELALDQPNKALVTLSNYFRNSGRVVDDVDARFSLVFAYAYARRQDIDQSLAWFSRVLKVAANDPGLREAGENGLSSILKSLADDRLIAIADQWMDDSAVRSLLGQERARRAGGGSVELAGVESPWGASGLMGPSNTASGAGMTVGVLLPLSGQFSNLGRSVKNGIELALAGYMQGQPQDGAAAVRVVYRDAGADALQAVDQARALVSSDGVQAVLGPLLSEHAVAVGEFARKSLVPLVSLAKNSNFATGENIFRLGATADSQIRSLLEGSGQRLGIKRYAMIYPDDANGRELADTFRAELGTRGLSLVYQTSYPRGDSDVFVSIAAALELANAEAVFFPDGVNIAAQFFGALSPGYRERVKPLGAAIWDNPMLLANSSTVLDGAVFVTPFFASSSRPAIVQFNEAYRNKYGTAPDFLAAQGFDAMTIVLEAAKRQRAEGIALPSALRQLDAYEGLTGNITVGNDGEMLRQFSVVQLIGGKIKEVPPAETPTFTLHGQAGIGNLSGSTSVFNNTAEASKSPMYIVR